MWRSAVQLLPLYQGVGFIYQPIVPDDNPIIALARGIGGSLISLAGDYVTGLDQGIKRAASRGIARIAIRRGSVTARAARAEAV